MKHPYVYLEPSLYEKYYLSQSGQGDVYRSPVVYQRGYGIGSLFRSLFRMATPLLKSGARLLGRQALKTGMDLAGDALAERDMRQAFKERMKEAGSNIANEVFQRGQGKRRRKNIKRVPPKKKLRTREDIFE